MIAEQSSLEEDNIHSAPNDVEEVPIPSLTQQRTNFDDEEHMSDITEPSASNGYWNIEEERSLISALLKQLQILDYKIDNAFAHANPLQHIRCKLKARKSRKSNSKYISPIVNTLSQVSSSSSKYSTQQKLSIENSQNIEAPKEKSSASAAESSSSPKSTEIDVRLLLDVFFSSNISWTYISNVVKSRGPNQCRNHWYMQFLQNSLLNSLIKYVCSLTVMANKLIALSRDRASASAANASARRSDDGDGGGDGGEKQLSPSGRIEHLLRELHDKCHCVTLSYTWFAEDSVELVERFAPLPSD